MNNDNTVFPAYAGMSRQPADCCSSSKRFPRLRGDEPPASMAARWRRWFSPPTRG